MESRIVIISIEEYKELLTLKIETEIKAKYESELSSIREDLALEKESSAYWYKRQCETELELKALKEKGGE